MDHLRLMVAGAGLVDLELTPREGAVEAMLPVDDPMALQLMEQLPAGTRPSDFIASFIISARKPRR